ncbi:hypothetical protein kam1_1688 [Methylacidiphilum kamchatkense Kam1]|uniref:Uncharacterized protein n=1 Tax=Methylacidiphilum kamchatkense Kam1 TaxID=1202785 RepID=A0A516TNS0_9BACT|nr:hypothetical protein kam1_1688 [Methylacidiphilum kamchatkense Kam1]
MQSDNIYFKRGIFICISERKHMFNSIEFTKLVLIQFRNTQLANYFFGFY